MGCKKCASEKLAGGYCFDLFENNPELKESPCLFYIVKMKNNNEEFIKIGITIQTLKNRFWGRFGYKFEEIYTEQTTLYEAFLKENNIKNNYKNLKYTPKIKMAGWTECFNKDILKEILS